TPSKRKAGGDLISVGAITNSVLNVGNANIAGHIYIGSHSAWITLNGSVGDLPWVDANTPGIQPGWAGTNGDFYFPAVVLPNTTWLPSSGTNTGGFGVVDGIAYSHVFGVSGDYLLDDTGSIYVDTNVTVRLNITVTNFHPNAIYVAGMGTNAGRMFAYLNGP